MTNLNRLKEVREREGMTQSELSIITGIGIATISKIENHHVPKAHRVAAIAILNVFADEDREIFPDFWKTGGTL